VAEAAPVTKVAVPSGLTQIPLSQAQSALQAKGLTSTVVYHTSTSVTKGYVISTDPAAGTMVPQNSSVTLTVSSGQADTPVPSLSGLQESAAYSLLNQAGLTVGNVTNQTSSTYPAAGTVINSNPPAGTQVAPGSAVSIVVSSGAPPTTTTTTSSPTTTTTTSTPSSSTTTTSTSQP
jgi:serine/threonine-protein kinase